MLWLELEMISSLVLIKRKAEGMIILVAETEGISKGQDGKKALVWLERAQTTAIQGS